MNTPADSPVYYWVDEGKHVFNLGWVAWTLDMATTDTPAITDVDAWAKGPTLRSEIIEEIEDLKGWVENDTMVVFNDRDRAALFRLKYLKQVQNNS